MCVLVWRLGCRAGVNAYINIHACACEEAGNRVTKHGYRAVCTSPTRVWNIEGALRPGPWVGVGGWAAQASRLVQPVSTFLIVEASEVFEVGAKEAQIKEKAQAGAGCGCAYHCMHYGQVQTLRAGTRLWLHA
eukprot:1152755-Pelagomonas_calceolata.AAC.3